MKISIDLDGTFWVYEEFFREFMFSMQSQGHEIGILTGHHHDQRENDLKLLEIAGCKPDFWIGRDPTDNPCTAIDKMRAIIKNEIDWHFDDCEYGNAEAMKLLGAMHQVIMVRPK